jgi:hypothetical protein
MIGPMADLDLARHQWEEGRRAVERARPERAEYLALTRRIDAITAELTRRIGQTFTLAELAAFYQGSDRWVLETIDDAFPGERPGNVSTAADAAFDLYARRASDYEP